MYYRLATMGLIFFLFLTSCSTSSGSEAQGDYPKVKEITLDVLHTEEGKKVLLDLMSESDFKHQLMTKDADLEQIIIKSISDKKTQKDWQKILSEESVASKISKVNESQQKQLLKTLMKDPEYQKMMLDILKDPQFSIHLVELMKSPTYRKEAIKIMEEALETPNFREKIKKMMQKSETEQDGNQQKDPQENSTQKPEQE